MPTTELHGLLLSQAVAALQRTSTESQRPEPDLELLAYTAMAATLAGISTRLLDALTRHQPGLARQLAKEILDLRDEPSEMTDYVLARAYTELPGFSAPASPAGPG
ncbi:hypothetical protein [Streptomyces californicus]|uniref:hypothetical protein n=1 Tax=Streptomyces californicus TaxID=67351 RepID=UPI00296EE54A|nr:hypothetical protein [Streptomyces californicus]MDW4912443.1 hypothetical protein [Streptomyces californicus]